MIYGARISRNSRDEYVPPRLGDRDSAAAEIKKKRKERSPVCSPAALRGSAVISIRNARMRINWKANTRNSRRYSRHHRREIEGVSRNAPFTRLLKMKRKTEIIARRTIRRHNIVVRKSIRDIALPRASI